MVSHEDEVSGFVELAVPDVLASVAKPNVGAPKSLLDYDWIATATRTPHR